jgi:hypothetical protein
LRRQK